MPWPRETWVSTLRHMVVDLSFEPGDGLIDELRERLGRMAIEIGSRRELFVDDRLI